jgi:HK97 family phage portal protein
MSIVGRLPRLPFINLSLSDEKSWQPSLWNLAGSQDISGSNVNESSALTYSAVWNAINLYSGSLSTLPLHLLQSANKKTVEVRDRRLFHVLHSAFNPIMTASVGRSTMIAHLMTWGNCYAEKVRNGYGEITQLWPISPNRVTPTMEDGQLVYKITVDTQTYTFTRDKILHIPGLGFDGFQGYSVIAMARKSIGLGMAMETFGSLFFGQGSHPGVAVSHPGTMKDPKAFREAFAEEYEGLSNAHRVLLLQEGMKLEKIGIPPEDAQFLESREFQIPEIARWFNLPVHKLKAMQSSTNNNIENEQISYVVDSLLPVAINFEQNLDLQLLSDNERFKQFLYFRHNFDGLLRGNNADRAAYYKTMSGIGGMTINDIRRKENFDPFPDAYADEPFIAVNNMIPLSKIDEWMKNQSKPTVTSNPTAPKEAKPANIVNQKKEKVPWKKIYEEGDAHWTESMQSSQLAQSFAQELLVKSKKSILEIGCGNGRDSILFALAGLKVTAIDIVPEAIEIAKQNAKDAGVEIDFQVGSAESLKFSDNSFDSVFSLSVLHSTNMNKSIPEIDRVLKKKGMMTLYVYSDVERIDGSKESFVTVNEFVNLMKKNNFSILDIYTHPEEEFDEAAERHLIIVAKVEK